MLVGLHSAYLFKFGAPWMGVGRRDCYQGNDRKPYGGTKWALKKKAKIIMIK